MVLERQVHKVWEIGSQKRKQSNGHLKLCKLCRSAELKQVGRPSLS